MAGDEGRRGTAHTGLATALANAENLLADTADAVCPSTHARELLAHLTAYRAHLAALVTAAAKRN